jgi:putative ABC transport system ATP-binding protein
MNQDERVRLLGGLALFRGCTKRQLRSVAKLARVVQIEPGEMLITAGSASTDAYLITAGSAEATGSKVKGRGGSTVRFGPGDVVGELGLLLDRPRSATVRATTPLECLALGRDDLRAAVETSPELGWSLLQTVAERLDG